MITEKIQQTRLIASGYAERKISEGKLLGKRQTHSPPPPLEKNCVEVAPKFSYLHALKLKIR